MNIAMVNRFIGTPWSYPDSDCWQIFKQASKAVFDLDIPEVNVPEKSDDKEAARLFELHARKSCWRRVDGLRPGCAVLFRNMQSGVAVHIGLHIQNGDILHCAQKLNCRYDNIRVLRKLFGSAEYYEYAPNHGTQ